MNRYMKLFAFLLSTASVAAFAYPSQPRPQIIVTPKPAGTSYPSQPRTETLEIVVNQLPAQP